MEENFIIANRTDTGATREVNEDSMVTFDSPNGRVIAVCDGMGGQAAGDVASRHACDIIRDILESNTFTTPTEAITRAVMAANQGILHRTASSPELVGMGSTCVIVIIKDGLVYYGWVGDSRIYYFSNGSLRQISRDQSYVQQLVDSGQLSAAEAEHHPQKNEITNALGLETMTPPELCTAPLTPEPGSIIMLCSDGLSGMVGDAQMQEILANPSLSLQEKADTLVNAANAAGGLDNITVQLVEFGAGAAAGMGAGMESAGMAPAMAAAKPVMKKNNRWMTIICIILVVLIAGLGIAYFLGGKKVEKTEQVEKGTSEDDREVRKPIEHQKTIQTVTSEPAKSSSKSNTSSTPSVPRANNPKDSKKKPSVQDQLKDNNKQDKNKKQGQTPNDLLKNSSNQDKADPNGLKYQKGSDTDKGNSKSKKNNGEVIPL